MKYNIVYKILSLHTLKYVKLLRNAINTAATTRPIYTFTLIFSCCFSKDILDHFASHMFVAIDKAYIRKALCYIYDY
jgi:hypothetical protein